MQVVGKWLLQRHVAPPQGGPARARWRGGAPRGWEDEISPSTGCHCAQGDIIRWLASH